MMNLSTLLLLFLSLSAPAAAEAKQGHWTPERVYRQLRQEPAIRTREEALELLAGASPGDLWRSAKLSADERIKDLLAQAALESLGEEVQSRLHAGMLEVRSAFWAEDLEKLSAAGRELRSICESGGIGAEAESPVDAEGLRERVLALVEEVEIAIAVQRCARREPHLEPADALDCALRGGPRD